VGTTTRRPGEQRELFDRNNLTSETRRRKEKKKCGGLPEDIEWTVWNTHASEKELGRANLPRRVGLAKRNFLVQKDNTNLLGFGRRGREKGKTGRAATMKKKKEGQG